jgi:CrcB protein
MIIPYLWVALGSALGGVARYALSLWSAEEGLLPLGTLGINIFGSFIIGLTFALTMPGGAFPAGANMRVFIMTGLCGGFTTFSAFSLQAVEMLREGQYGAALGYMAGSVIFCVVAAALGFWLAARLGLPQSASP